MIKKIIFLGLICLLSIIPLVETGCSKSTTSTPAPAPTSPESSTPPIISSQIEMSVEELLQLVSRNDPILESFFGKHLKITGTIETKGTYGGHYPWGFVRLAAADDMNPAYTKYGYLYAGGSGKDLSDKVYELKVGDRVVIEGKFFGLHPYDVDRLEKIGISSAILPPIYIGKNDVAGMQLKKITKIP